MTEGECVCRRETACLHAMSVAVRSRYHLSLLQARWAQVTFTNTCSGLWDENEQDGGELQFEGADFCLCLEESETCVVIRSILFLNCHMCMRRV